MDNSRRRPNASNNRRGRPLVGSIQRSLFSIFANVHRTRSRRITGPSVRTSSPASVVGHLPGAPRRGFVRVIVHFHPDDDVFNSPIVVYFPLLPPEPDSSEEFHSVPVFSGPFPVNHIPGLHPLLGGFTNYPVALGPFLSHNIPYISGSIPIYHVPCIPGAENVPHCPVLYEADENDPNSTYPGYSIFVPVPHGAIPAVQLYVVPSDLIASRTHFLVFQHGYMMPPTNHICYLNARERRNAREDLAQVSCAHRNPRGPSEDFPVDGIRNGRQEAPNHPVDGMRNGRQERPNSPVIGMRIGRQERPNSPVLGMRIGRQERPNSPVIGMRIGRQERLNSSVLGMRIGRQERPNSPVLGMRIGRQERPNSPVLGMRIGRQERPHSPVLGMRIGRQERPNSPVIGMRIGRQERPNSPVLGMRIGRQERPNSPVLGMRIGRQERPHPPVVGMRIGRQERPNSPVIGMRIGRQERPNSPVLGMRIGRQEIPYPPVVGMRIGRQGAPVGFHRSRRGTYNPVVQSEGFVQNLTSRYSGASANFRSTGTGRHQNGRGNVRGSPYFRNRGIIGKRPLHSCGSNDPAHDCLWDQPQRRNTAANRAGRQPTKPIGIVKPPVDVESAGAKPKKKVDAPATKQEMQPTANSKAPKKTKKKRNDKPDGSATSQPIPNVTTLKPPRKTKNKKIDINVVNRAIFRVLTSFEEEEHQQSQGASAAAAPEDPIPEDPIPEDPIPQDPIPEDEVPKKREKPKKSAAKKANKEDSGEGTTQRKSRYRPSYNYLRNPRRDDSSDTEEVKIRKYDEHGNRVPTYRQALHYCTKYHEEKTRKKLRKLRREGEIAQGGQGSARTIVDDWLGDCTTTESDSDSSFITDEDGDPKKPSNTKEMMAYYYEIKALKEEEKKKKKKK